MKATRYVILLITVIAGMCVWAQTHVTKGNASYYSDKLHGRRMSNGQRYNRDSFTCAHLKYPLGTLLKVRNPINNRECIVEVTDRGPHSRRFIIDLSKAAARYLGILGGGFTQVEITPYVKGQVPYKLETELEDIPELDLDYAPAAVYPEPAWQQKKDSVTAESQKKVPSTKSQATKTPVKTLEHKDASTEKKGTKAPTDPQPSGKQHSPDKGNNAK